jgi:hypothetical protein
LNRHNAPPVLYPIGRSFFLGSLLAVLWLAGLISVSLWWYATRHADWRMALALALAAVLVAGIAARLSWNNLPIGQLAWNGEVWRWESASYQTGIAELELSVIADFQFRLLLRLENHARASLWLWAEQRTMPDRWLDLRRAVYSPHKSPASSPQHDFFPADPSYLSSSSVTASIAKQPVDVP